MQSALLGDNMFTGCYSLMNVTFCTKSDEINADFVRTAEQNRIVNIKGHRAIGGMRASIYNAMPIEGVQHLVAFMKKFESDGGRYGK